MKTYCACYISPVGNIKIECTDQNIIAIIFFDETTSAEECDHFLLQSAKAQLDEYFSGKRKAFDLPLAQPGTDFQQKVWTLLYRISYGKTISYQTLSKQYGEVKAIRAIASANGKNNLAIIIPCHRVIGTDGSLTGYAGGLWRKKWLLEHEAKYESGLLKLF